jgi:hypothetical protein
MHQRQKGREQCAMCSDRFLASEKSPTRTLSLFGSVHDNRGLAALFYSNLQLNVTAFAKQANSKAYFAKQASVTPESRSRFTNRTSSAHSQQHPCPKTRLM